MPRKVTVNTGFSNVQLPNGLFYNAGDQIVLTDEQGAKLLDTVFTKNVVNSAGASLPVLIDNGAYGTVFGSGNVAANVTGATGITSTGVGAYSGGTAGYNSATQATAIVTAVNALVADVTNLRTTLNQEIAAIKAAGLQATS